MNCNFAEKAVVLKIIVKLLKQLYSQDHKVAGTSCFQEGKFGGMPETAELVETANSSLLDCRRTKSTTESPTTG